MNQSKLEIINSIIQKVLSKTRKNCEQFAKQFFASIEPQGIDDCDTIKIFQDLLDGLTNISNENIEKTMQLAVHQDFENQWKEARSKFFTESISQKLNEIQASKKDQKQIGQLFTTAKQCQNKLDINVERLGNLSGYSKQIEELKGIFQSINEGFSRKQRECPAIVNIIKLKLTFLKIIKIQYSVKFQQCRYSVSAFELFRLIYENKDLFSVTVKGVNVQQFQKFIVAMKLQKNNEMREGESLEKSWMKNFKPSKFLNLAIDSQISLKICYKQKTLSNTNDLVQFVKLFGSVSNMKVIIRLGVWSQFDRERRKTFQHIIKQLKIVHKIKIEIWGEYNDDLVDQSFIMVFQALTSFTEIIQLQFFNIRFDLRMSINRFLATEQFLNIIFQNNLIKHLTVLNCKNFPIFPKLSALTTLSLGNISFRKQVYFISEFNRNDSPLRVLKLQKNQQVLRIEEQLFDGLEELQIISSQNIYLGNMSPQYPSNLKYLRMDGPYLGNAHFLLFPKFTNLTELSLSNVGFQHLTLCTIPSSNLQQLHIYKNHQFRNEGIQAIDKKWPFLRRLTLYECPNLNGQGWNTCQFKGLIQLRANKETLDYGHHFRQMLNSKGVKLHD